jgi:hypothetical protein
MPFVSGWDREIIEREKKGREEGREEGLLLGLLQAVELQLRFRFGSAGLRLLPRVRKIESAGRLRALLKAVQRAASLDDFAQALEKQTRSRVATKR